MGLIIDIFLSIPVALLLTLLVMMLIYGLMSVLTWLYILMIYVISKTSDKPKTYHEIRKSAVGSFYDIDLSGFNSKATNIVFFILWLLLIYLSTQLEGFPFPALIGG